MDCAIIIQARLGSKRFPRKMLAHLDGMPVIEWVLRNCLSVDPVVPVVLATNDDALVRFARRVDYCDRHPLAFRSWRDEADVLGRYVDACDCLFGEADRWVIRVCGDSPLIDPRGLSELMGFCRRDHSEYVGHGTPEQPAITSPNGYLAEAVRLNTLRQLDRQLDPHDPAREHVTQAVYRDGTRACCYLPLPTWLADVPVFPAAIDTIGDLARVGLAVRREATT